MIKVRDLILLQESYSIWWKHSPNATAASQNGMINLWCNSRFSSHFLQQKQKWLLIHGNGSFLPNEVIPVSCDIFTSLMKNMRDLIFLQEESRTYSLNATATSQKEVINLWCDSRLSSHWRKMEHAYYSTGTDLSMEMKWVICHDIYLHRGWQTFSILHQALIIFQT